MKLDVSKDNQRALFAWVEPLMTKRVAPAQPYNYNEADHYQPQFASLVQIVIIRPFRSFCQTMAALHDLFKYATQPRIPFTPLPMTRRR